MSQTFIGYVNTGYANESMSVYAALAPDSDEPDIVPIKNQWSRGRGHKVLGPGIDMLQLSQCRLEVRSVAHKVYVNGCITS